MDLPKISDLSVANKKVLLRADLDVDNPNDNDARLIAVSETVKYLSQKDAKVIIIGHRGRPNGKVDKQFSLKPVCSTLAKISNRDIDFVPDTTGPEAASMCSKMQRAQIVMLENLRFDPGEEANDTEFAKKLVAMSDYYVNEAFASSHGNHASIVAVPREIRNKDLSTNSVAIGLRFAREVENLSKVFTDPHRPLVFVISGLKEDKLDYIKSFETLADKILIGGRLPEFLGDKALESVRTQNGKVIVGNLVMDKEDITLNTVDKFGSEIAKARTVVVSGPLGRFESEGHRQGTEKVFNAVVQSSAFKIAGGGDTEDAIRLLNLTDKFDWVSVGGGAMLEFLSNHTLSGIESMNDALA